MSDAPDSSSSSTQAESRAGTDHSGAGKAPGRQRPGDMLPVHERPSTTHALSATGVVSWTLSLLSPHRRGVAVLALLSVAEIALRALSPWPLKAVVDHVAGGAPLAPWLERTLLPIDISPLSRVLVTIVVLGLALQLAHQLVLMLHTRLYAQIGQRMVFGLRARLFAHLQSLSLAHHERTPKGDVVYRLEADATCVEHLLLRGIFPVTFSALTLVVMFAVLASIDGLLALLTLAIAPALFVAMRGQARHMAARAERTKALESKVVARAYESFATIRLVKGFGRERHEVGRFTSAAGDAMASRLDLTAREARYSLLISAISVVGGMAVLGAGGLHVIDGRLSAGTLLLVMAYVGYVYGPMTAIAYTTGSIQQAVASARRVHETFALRPESTDLPDALDARHLTGRVAFEDVSFAYRPGEATLSGVSFEARPGELIALVGRSGAGKTTLVSLLTRFFEPTAGRVLVDGVDARRYRLESLRQRIGIVLQDALLVSGSIAENIRYGRLDATDREVEEAARLAGAAGFIERLPAGYATDMAEAGAGFSGGERQRLSIARAFLKDAPILILDEPTAALDAISEARILEAVQRLRQGRTLFVIAHRLSTVRQADRILVLERGRIVADGTHEALLHSSALYAEMCRTLAEPGRQPFLDEEREVLTPAAARDAAQLAG